MIVNKNPAEEIEAVVFDLDATLLDTEPNWFLADKRLFAEYGIDLTFDKKTEFIGKSLHHMVQTLCRRYNLQVDESRLAEKKNRYYLEIALGNTHMFDEIRPFFESLIRRNIPVAIASGTASSVIRELLTDLDILSHFRFYLGSEDVIKGKPSPEIYLLAAEKLSLPPGQIMVLEDSPHGILSAKEAGMYCIGIPYLFEEKDRSAYMRADILFPGGMKQFDHKKVLNLTGL